MGLLDTHAMLHPMMVEDPSTTTPGRLLMTRNTVGTEGKPMSQSRMAISSARKVTTTRARRRRPLPGYQARPSAAPRGRASSTTSASRLPCRGSPWPRGSSCW